MQMHKHVLFLFVLYLLIWFRFVCVCVFSENVLSLFAYLDNVYVVVVIDVQNNTELF